MGVLEDKGRARLFYRYLSTVYDRVNPLFWNEAMREAALDWLEVDPADRVLDVGCGTGFATESLLARAGEVHGLDQSVHQLGRARAKLAGRGPVSFSLGDAERLPFRDDAFDLVWSSGSIEYWPDPVAALRECRRVARPGGRVLVVGPDTPRSRLFREIADAIMLFYDAEEADRMFREAGYDDVAHRVMRAMPVSPRAIVTRATVPG